MSKERPHERRGRRLVVSAVAVIMTVGLLLPSAPASSRSRCVRWGALVPSAPGEASNLDALERSVGRTVDYFGYYQGWASRDAFDFGRARAALARGATPVVAWEPWDWLAGPEQPDFALSRIVAGDFDDYIRGWAVDARAFGHRVLLRFAYEMNGNWMPWSEGINGNKPGEYVQAWRHVHRIFREEGAANVRWVWAPNVVSPDYVPLKRLYPGDRYVDLVGIDGYNWGSTQPSWRSRWHSFDEIFLPTIRQVRRITSKRILITETASTEQGGNKARWIRKTLATFDRYPDIIGFMWFNYDKETDWRIQSSPEALRAFRKGIRNHRFNCDQRLRTSRRVVRQGQPVKLIARVRPRVERGERVFLYRGSQRIRSRRTGPGLSRFVFRVRPGRTWRYTVRVPGLPAHDLGPSRSKPVRIRVR